MLKQATPLFRAMTEPATGSRPESRMDKRSTRGGAGEWREQGFSGQVLCRSSTGAPSRGGSGDGPRGMPAKFRGFFPLLRALIFSLAALLSAQSVSATAIDKLHRFLESTRTVRADFSQIVVAKNGRKPQQSSGVMLLSRPGKFRWQIEKPYSQLLLGDGEKVWIYDPDLRQVTVKKVGAALGGSPAALLAGDSSLDKNSLDKNFTLSEAGEREGIEWLEAIPKSTDSGFEKIRLGFVGADLKSMELFDNFGQTTTLLFFRFERNPALAPTLFRFVPPAGADVIGD